MRIAAVLLALFVLLEPAAYCAGRVLQAKRAMYRDPLDPPAKRTYQDYLAVRDPDLGWPYPHGLNGTDYMPDGSVPSPANEALAAAEHAVSLYGDSFTWGLCNSTPEQTWGNCLARLLGKRVKNFGVPAYGSDQAYLRYLRNTRDRPPVVVLAHMSRDIVRNLTRMRDLVGEGDQAFFFKPRFILGPDGALQLVPIPNLSEQEYRRLVGLERPQLHLEHENFSVGGPGGAVRLRFPFTLSVARNLRYWRMHGRLRREPEFLSLYRKDHPLHGYQITLGILKAFHAEALRRGQRPIVVLFPSNEDLTWERKSGGRVLGELLQDLRAAGVETVDFGAVLNEWLGERDPETAFDTSHFVPEVEPVVAEAVRRQIASRP